MMSNFTALTAVKMARGAIHPSFSPNGSFVLYHEGSKTLIWDRSKRKVVRRYDGNVASWACRDGQLAVEHNEEIYLINADGVAIWVGKGIDCQWSPSKKLLYWIQKEETQNVLVELHIEQQGKPKPVIPINRHLPWALSPDGKWLAYVCVGQAVEKKPSLPASVIRVECSSRSCQVVVINVKTKRRFTSGMLKAGADVTGLAWSPDSRKLTYDWEVTWNDNGKLLSRRTCLWEFDNNEPYELDLGKGFCTSRSSWSTDGSRVALLVNRWGCFTTDYLGWIAVFDVLRGTLSWTCTAVIGTSKPMWAKDDQTLYCRSARHTEQPYVAIGEKGKNVRHLTPKGYYCSRADLSPDGKTLAVSARRFMGINEILLCPTSGKDQPYVSITSKKNQYGRQLKVWTHSWKAKGNQTLDGIVLEPIHASKELPLLVLAMFGTRGCDISFLESNGGFMAKWIAEQGYRVFMPCHRLTGLVGLKYLKEEFLLYGAAVDIVKGVNSLRHRLKVTRPVLGFGHSIGGDILCEVINSYPILFDAVVLSGIQPDPAILYSLEGTNPILRATFDGPPWQYPLKYFRASRMRDIEKVITPILIMMGEKDTSCPNARQFYLGLTELGKEATFLLFKEQAHWPEDAEQMATYLKIALGWLNKHTVGF
jgi:dipeptidyl aminopeptidase/acylaminoacyl peptidase